MGVVDHQQHAGRTLLAGGQVLDQGQAELAFIHSAVRLSKLVEDRLQEGPSGGDRGPPQHGHAELSLEMLGHQLAQQGLASSRRSDRQTRPFAPLHATDQVLPGRLDGRGGEIVLDLGDRREGSST